MTRKQAITEAIDALTRSGNTAPISVLEAMRSELPISHWSREHILDAVEQFIADNGRLPTAKEFQPRYKLPNRAIVKRHFGVTADELLKAYFAEYRSKKLSSPREHVDRKGAKPPKREVCPELISSTRSHDDDLERIQSVGENLRNILNEMKNMPKA